MKIAAKFFSRELCSHFKDGYYAEKLTPVIRKMTGIFESIDVF